MRYLRCVVWGCLGVTAVAFLTGCPPPQQSDWSKVYLDARTTLHQAAEDTDPQVRSRALEGLADTEGRQAGPLILQGLQDTHPPVRFAAAMAAGEVRYERATPLLLGMAKDPQTPPKLLCAVIYALHRVGETAYTTKLGEFLNRDDDKWIRATAAMVMGKLGEPAAMEPLDDLRRNDRDAVVLLQVVEAMAALGDERAGALLRSYTKSRFLEDRIIAVQGLARVRTQGTVYFLRKLLNDSREDPAVRAVAAGSLAQLGEPSGYALLVRFATNPRKAARDARGGIRVLEAEVVNLQTLAILALGHMGDLEAVQKLHPLVFSPNGTVRVAACKAVLQLLRKHRLDAAPPPPPEPAPILVRPPAAPVALPSESLDEPPGPPSTEPAATEPATQPAEPATAPAKPPTTATAPTTQPATLPSVQPPGPKGLRSAGAKD